MNRPKTQACPNCDGEGFLMNRGQQIAAGIISLGVFPLIDAALSDSPQDSEFSRRCKVCDGRGYVDGTEEGR